MDVWEWAPLIALITLAGLVSIQPQVLEAARVDGANYLRAPQAHSPSLDHWHRNRGAPDPLDGRSALLRHHLAGNQRRPGERHQDNPLETLRERLPLLRTLGYAATIGLADARCLHPGRQPVHGILRTEGVGEMSKNGSARLSGQKVIPLRATGSHSSLDAGSRRVDGDLFVQVGYRRTLAHAAADFQAYPASTT